MRSRTTARFRAAYQALPPPVQRQARIAYGIFLRNPYHPSLRFKQVHPNAPLFSVRIGRGYRALGLRDGDLITWLWIGGHDEYDRILAGR